MISKGQKINGRYQIVRTIGEGGMANVYLAHDTILERNVAVKVLRGDLATDEKFVRRFQREALSASSLSHPNIVEVYDVGEEEGQYYIVMEYIEGRNLKELIKKRNNLTVVETNDIMLQLTDGLSQAHESYIVHRDIKPQNILILENGMIKITDFGIALAVNNLSLTQTNSVMGSVHYLPPEQASGKGSTIKSDIYSLGILMFELLTGRVPFKGDTAVEIALKHMKDPLPSAKKLVPEIPQSIENIILKACAKNPKNRYNNVREMNFDIQTSLDEKRINEPRLVFEFPENDSEDTKIMPAIKEDTNKEIAVQINSDDSKKQRTIVLVLASVLLSLMVLFSFIFLILPRMNKIEEITVPDVAEMSLVDAEKLLKKEGFSVNVDVEYVEHDRIKKDYVVKTSPSIGRTVKEDTVVTIYLSLGTKKIVLDDYVKEDANKAQGVLETLGFIVIIKPTLVDDINLYKDNEVIKQEPAAGESLVSGDTVTLYVPNKEVYPDMVTDKWNEDAAVDFAEKYNLNLTVLNEVSTLPAGTVIYQSRQRGTTITRGSTLTIKIAIADSEEEVVE